jgi:Flp pilus assembly protein TadD
MDSNRLSALPRLFICVFCFVVASAPSWSFPSVKCEDWLAKAVSVQGNVEARRAGEPRWFALKLDDLLCPGDMVRVRENSRAALLFRNESIVRLDQNTTITLPMATQETTEIDFFSGIALFFSRSPFSLRILTPFVNANIEGTEFVVKVGAGETFISVYEGKVSASNDSGSLTILAGQSAAAGAGEAPTLRAVARPQDAVNWALYYPPIPVSDLEHMIYQSKQAEAALRESLQAYRRSDFPGALAELKNAVPEPESAAYYSYRALLHLTVGRAEEAALDLKMASLIDPGYSYSLALQSVIAVVQNRKDEALELSRKAVELDHSSAAALIALSYVHQARFELDSALSSVRKAADAAPQDALVLARLAELWLSKGYLKKALETARDAVAINPEISRTQTVLGYAYLTQIRTRESQAAFRKAIGLDQADPLPRLGLGLALIREGKLKAGRTEIEIAAMLDPNNSLVRSYLGKAYYEEKEDKKAAVEFSRAKELDSLDPTPWFYEAIRKQTVNRPVEALSDLQQSIALNDNRAVYRSRLLLDEDLAARSVSLARIYEDLGFNWLALTEGAKSLERDPANFSAHRFLADAYFSLPRHDIVRVSELLQSQLLQPLNILPIQPQQAESNRFLLNGLGPRDSAYNEYTPLFTRNQLALLLGGTAGERSTFSESVVQSGIQGPFSYSLGQFHQETDGFRLNNDQKHNIYDAFIQARLSPRTSVQAEFRHKDSEFGDLRLLFDPIFIDPSFRNQDWREMYRFGLHHSFAPGSDLIGSFMYLRAKPEAHTRIPFPLDLTSDDTGVGAEVQHIYRSSRFNFVIGTGHFNIDEDLSITAFGTTTPSPTTTRHTNLYIYSNWNFPKDVVWTLGASGDFFDGGTFQLDTEQLNPKFGVTWTPFPGTTLRAAVFRTIKRTLLTDQTVEPTQVAGFNQFFDDGEGTDAWRYGVGLDQRLTDRLFAGVEFSRRDMDVPAFEPTPPFALTTTDASENLGRAYLYWTPHKWFALGPEYQYELTEFGPELPAFGISRLETHRAAIGIGFFHPSGFLSRVRPAFVFQDGDFRVFPGAPVFTGDSSFFVLDASIGYRLPRRLGLIELVAKNLFDESFQFQDTDPMNPQITPKRLLMGRWTFSF